MLPDAECLKIAVEILSELNIGSFTIKVCELDYDDAEVTRDKFEQKTWLAILSTF